MLEAVIVQFSILRICFVFVWLEVRLILYLIIFSSLIGRLRLKIKDWRLEIEVWLEKRVRLKLRARSMRFLSSAICVCTSNYRKLLVRVLAR